jgi:tryptophan synthase alpha chain
MNRIDNCFARLRSEKRKGFIPYICAGDPSFEKTVDLARALEKAGAHIIELGVPFSDPLADGIVNQLAAQRALAAGATVRGVLECVREIRRNSEVPMVLYTYLNPIFQFGFEKFHSEAQTAGVDGLLILDLPPEEAVNARKLDCLKQSSSEAVERGNVERDNVFHIRLIAPTTSPERIKKIAAKAKGFLYYVSREGVTGEQKTISSTLGETITQLRGVTSLPIAVGFGISTPEQAREVASHADAVVVGSAIVDLIAKHGKGSELIEKVSVFARSISDAIKSVRD